MNRMWLLLAVLGACGGPEKTAPDPSNDDRLSGDALVRRLSFDLRGFPPDPADLERARTEGWQAVRDQYLADPALEERLVYLLAERWHTRVDAFDIVPLDYGLDVSQEYAFERAVGEEPLRVAARIIAEDRPWSELVTADWTMTEDILATVWPLSTDPGETGWRRAQYNDGRPNAGILSSNGLWWRYTSTSSNMNRGRAAAISRLLLCEDYLVRPVRFSTSNINTDGVESAVRSDPYCLGCHASLDPIAASLFGFWWLSLYSEIEETTYHAEREALWGDVLGVAPAWYGAPIAGLSELGFAVASDSRYYTCAVQTFAESLWQRPTTGDDAQVLEDLRQHLLAEDTRIRPLLAAITETDAYRDPNPRLLHHDQLRQSVLTLTGFDWRALGAPMLDTDASGFRLLLGGVDGESITSAQTEPGLTWALVLKRLSEAAATTVVDQIAIGQSSSPLLDVAALESKPDEAAFVAAIDHLFVCLFSRSATEAEQQQVATLWTAIAENEGPEAAWAGVLSALLRDPAFLTY